MNSKTKLIESMTNPREWFPAIFVESPGKITTVQHTFEYKIGLAPNQSGIDYDGIERLITRTFEENGYYPSYRFFFHDRVEDGVKNTYLVVCTKESEVLNEITADRRTNAEQFHTINGAWQKLLYQEINGFGPHYLVRGDSLVKMTKNSINDPALFAEYKDPNIVNEQLLRNPANFEFHPESWVRNNEPYKGK